MRIVRAELRGVPGLPPQITFAAAPPFVTILHAENGPFARRVVDLLVAAKERIGPYGVLGPAPWPVERGAANVALEIALDAEERDFAASEEVTLEARCRLGASPERAVERHHHGLSAVLGRYDPDGVAGRFERVAGFRSLEGGPPGGSLPTLRKALCLSTHPKKLAGIPQVMIDAARDRTAVAERFAAALARLGAAVTFAGTRVVAGRHELAFTRKGRTEGLFDLGLDEQHLVLFAGLFSAFPMSRSVLFIEEPELHQGESAIRAVVEGLVALAEGNQIIFATRHSAVVRACAGAVVVPLGES